MDTGFFSCVNFLWTHLKGVLLISSKSQLFVCVFKQALKVLRTAEFAPFVVFIAAPTITPGLNEVRIDQCSPQISTPTCSKDPVVSYIQDPSLMLLR